MSERGTFTLLNISSLAAGATSSFGTYIGLRNAKKISIWFEGSYGLSAGTPAQLQIYGAIEPSPGSIDDTIAGSIVLTKNTNSRERRVKTFDTLKLERYPFIVARAIHASGTSIMGAIKAKAIIQ